jgi:hypothetical protein
MTAVPMNASVPAGTRRSGIPNEEPTILGIVYEIFSLSILQKTA